MLHQLLGPEKDERTRRRFGGCGEWGGIFWGPTVSGFVCSVLGPLSELWSAFSGCLGVVSSFLRLIFEGVVGHFVGALS